MQRPTHILVTREEIARAGSVKIALDEALSSAALEMTPRAMTAYEAVGSLPTEADGAEIAVHVEVTNEEEVREAIGAGAESVVIVGVSEEETERLREIVRGLRRDLRLEEEEG